MRHLALACCLAGCGAAPAAIPSRETAPSARPTSSAVTAVSAPLPPIPLAPPPAPTPEIAAGDPPRPAEARLIPPIPFSTKPITPRPITVVEAAPDDPLHGRFTLADATRGLGEDGILLADIETSEGALVCRLLDGLAPRNVANFVGLARGLRPFKDAATGRWVKRPVYDGTTFHRVVRGFMIQGGDPLGTGRGEAGYVVPDEIWQNGAHDRAGLLCTANRGRDTNGMQFFITDGPAAHLDGGFTIYGSCGPLEVVRAIASVPVDGEKPRVPVEIRRVVVRRAK